MPNTTDQINNAIRSYLTVLIKKGVPIERVYLFGSQAKGTAEPGSDIDLLIVSPLFSKMPLWKRCEILGDALAEVLEPIEVIGYSPEEFEAKRNRLASFLGHILAQPETIEYHPKATLLPS